MYQELFGQNHFWHVPQARHVLASQTQSGIIFRDLFPPGGPVRSHNVLIKPLIINLARTIKPSIKKKQ